MECGAVWVYYQPTVSEELFLSVFRVEGITRARKSVKTVVNWLQFGEHLKASYENLGRGRWAVGTNEPRGVCWAVIKAKPTVSAAHMRSL
jgi:hypothetical protein